jgi:hypothetical protein
MAEYSIVGSVTKISAPEDARTIDPEKRIVVPEIINAYISYTIDNTYSKPALLASPLPPLKWPTISSSFL